MDMKIIIGASIGAALNGFKKIISAGQTVGPKIKSALSTALSPIASLTGLGLNIVAIQKVFSLLDNIGKGADRLQITTKAYQELQHAASQTGTNMERVEQSVGRSMELYQRAAKGDANAMKTLDKISLKWQELAGLSPDRIFDRLAEGLNKIEDPLQKFKAASDIFGSKNAQKLMPLISGLADLRREANDLNVIIAEETVRAAERAGDAFSRMGQKMLAGVAKSGFIDFLENVLENLDDVINKTTSVNAAKIGIYDRKGAVEKAISEGEKSGKYTPEQISKARKYSEGYANKANAGIFVGKEGYALIDQMLKESGFGHVARTSTATGWKSQFAGSADTNITPKITPEKAQADKDLKGLEKYIREFTTTSQTAEAAISELKAGAVEKLGRALTDEETGQLSGKIEDIKKQYEAMGQIRAEAAADTLAREELVTKALETQLAGNAEQVKLEQLKNDLKRRGLELSDEEWQKINKQLELQSQINQEIKARNAQKQIDSKIDDLDRKLQRQQMILNGQERDVFIQDEIDKAEKTAKDAGTELTPEQREAITEKAGRLYDMTHPPEPTRLVGPENKVFTDSLLRMGGQIGNINGQAQNQNYDKVQAEKLTSVETRLNMLYDKIPNRTENNTGDEF